MLRGPGACVLALTLLLAGCLGGSPPTTEPVQPADHPGTLGNVSLAPLPAFTWLPPEPLAGEPVQFLDRSKDPDDAIVARLWDFADGGASDEPEPRHTFASPGRYLVKLTVRDAAGHSASAAQVVRVGPLDPLRPHEEMAFAPRPHVVIALVDTGVNPYHKVFRATEHLDPRDLLDGYPADAQPLRLSLGNDYKANVATDDAAWKSVEEGQLYFVPGTRILGAVSFGNGTFGNAAANSVRILDDDGHGTATLSRAAIAAPEAWLVMVESGTEGLDRALDWVARQAWIDIVSLSFGPELNLPAAWPAYRLGDLRLATQEMVRQGKLVFAAAGNEPTLSVTSHINGPPWVVSVGGALPQGKGDPGTASKAMDIVSDYGPSCATRDSVEAMEPRSGTSFSAPTAAGAVAAALLHLRSAEGWTGGIAGGKLLPQGPGLSADGLTNAELRDALDGVATYWDPTAWTPGVGVPVLPAPWVQMGWGYIGPELAGALAQAVLSGKVPSKPDEARLYMGQVMAARETMWG